MRALAANRNFTGIQSAMIEEWLADLIASPTPSTQPVAAIENPPAEKIRRRSRRTKNEPEASLRKKSQSI